MELMPLFWAADFWAAYRLPVEAATPYDLVLAGPSDVVVGTPQIIPSAMPGSAPSGSAACTLASSVKVLAAAVAVQHCHLTPNSQVHIDVMPMDTGTNKDNKNHK